MVTHSTSTHSGNTSVTGLRRGRLFQRQSGHTLMIALDRPLLAGPSHHAENAEALLARFAQAPAEALLLSPGLTELAAHHLNHAEAPRIVTRIDYPLVADFAYRGSEAHQMICRPERAASLGADAVVMCLVAGYQSIDTHAANLRAVAEAAESCARIGLPLIVEAVLWGQCQPDPRDVSELSRICRIAAELGADIIKTQPPATTEGMAEIVESCPVPVTALGGSSLSPEAAAELARSAIAGGARGLIFGRNIWERDNALEVCEQLARIVHHAP